VVGGARPEPIYNRISAQIHNAVGQLDAVNPAMDHPNLLAIVNGDKGAGFTDLIQVLTGNAYCESGHVIPMSSGPGPENRSSGSLWPSATILVRIPSGPIKIKLVERLRLHHSTRMRYLGCREPLHANKTRH
jgi:hypothetical protein